MKEDRDLFFYGLDTNGQILLKQKYADLRQSTLATEAVWNEMQTAYRVLLPDDHRDQRKKNHRERVAQALYLQARKAAEVMNPHIQPLLKIAVDNKCAFLDPVVATVEPELLNNYTCALELVERATALYFEVVNFPVPDFKATENCAVAAVAALKQRLFTVRQGLAATHPAEQLSAEDELDNGSVLPRTQAEAQSAANAWLDRSRSYGGRAEVVVKNPGLPHAFSLNLRRS